MKVIIDDNWEIVNPGCGCPPFAVPSATYRRWRKIGATGEGASWWCPTCGDCRVFKGESEETKLKRQLHAAEGRANRFEAESTRASQRLDKLRARVKNGVCPCCNRSFENLRRHIETKHPEFGTGGALRLIRQALAMTQAELAEAAGVPAAYVSLYERDAGCPGWADSQLSRWMNTLDRT